MPAASSHDVAPEYLDAPESNSVCQEPVTKLVKFDIKPRNIWSDDIFSKYSNYFHASDINKIFTI